MSKYTFIINKTNIVLEINNNDIYSGEDLILSKYETDSTINTDWYLRGHTTKKIFDDIAEFRLLENACLEIVLSAFKKLKIVAPINFELKNYHKLIKSDNVHREVIKITRNLSYEDFSFDINFLLSKIARVLNLNLTGMNSSLKKNFIILRISRPNKLDINPPHKDAYLDVWKKTVNIWIPICGNMKKSSLGIVDRSHLISEKYILRTCSGALVDGLKYNVPAILSWKGSNTLIRSRVNIGEMLVFSPYLIHGCAYNEDRDITRVALELRPSCL